MAKDILQKPIISLEFSRIKIITFCMILFYINKKKVIIKVIVNNVNIRINNIYINYYVT